MNRSLSVLVCLLVAIILTGFTSLKSDVPLVWSPTNEVLDAGTGTLAGLYSYKYKIMPFTDMRENKKEIARNTEHNDEKLVTTRDDVAVWCRDNFEDIVKQHGLNVVKTNANVIIKGEVLKFYVTEDSMYKAKVGIRITVENAMGKILWQGVTTGAEDRFGRSHDLENYHKTLSDAYLNAVKSLLRDHGFQTALRGI